MSTHIERPSRRTNPSGKVAWQARWTDSKGVRHYGWGKKGETNYVKGTWPTRREAQAAIDRCHELDGEAPLHYDTVGNYFETWVANHPRMARTNETNEGRIRAVLDVELEGVKLRAWRFADLRRRHASALVTHMLVKQGRAATGAQGIMRALSAMAEDAINDDVCNANPFRGAKISKSDPRVTKQSAPIRVWSWEQMHALADAVAGSAGVADLSRLPSSWVDSTRGRMEAAAANRALYGGPMIRTLSDCGLRVGEMLPLRRGDLDLGALTLQVRRSVSAGVVIDGTKTDHHVRGAGRVVPVPPGLAVMLKQMMAATPTPINRDEALLFPTAAGVMWRYEHFRRDILAPAQKATGIDARPHEMRHSYVTLMRAAGVPDADLAAITGHSVLTMVSRYAHALGESFDVVRSAVG